MNSVSIKELRHGKEAESIAIRSLEGDIYVPFAVVNGESCRVTDAAGRTLKAPSLDRMRNLLDGVNCNEVRLVLDSPYDEMIGLGGAEKHAADLPLVW